jgi:hypothetical protein
MNSRIPRELGCGFGGGRPARDLIAIW